RDAGPSTRPRHRSGAREGAVGAPVRNGPTFSAMRRRVEEESYKRLYEEQRFLYQLGRDLERISLRTPDSHLLRVVLRRLGEMFQADLAIQTDVRYPDPCLETPYRLVLSKIGDSVDARTMDSLEEDFQASCSRMLAGQPLGPVRREMLVYGIDPDEKL